MQRKKELINKLSPLSTRNSDFDCFIECVLRVIYNRSRTETTPGDLRYAMLFVKKKGKKRKFSDTNRLPPDESSLKIKIKRVYYVTKGTLFVLIFAQRRENVFACTNFCATAICFFHAY